MDNNSISMIIDSIMNNFYLMLGFSVLIMFIACLLPFYLVPHRYTLSRSPYFLLMTLLFAIPYHADKFLNYFDAWAFSSLLYLAFMQIFLAMTFSIMRARDGFGRGAYAIMSLIPLLNFGLFTISHEEGGKPYPKNHMPLPLPSFFHGYLGTIIATLIWIFPYFVVLYFTAFAAR